MFGTSERSRARLVDQCTGAGWHAHMMSEALSAERPCSSRLSRQQHLCAIAHVQHTSANPRSAAGMLMLRIATGERLIAPTAGRRLFVCGPLCLLATV